MKTQLDITQSDDFENPRIGAVLTDKVTGYPIQIWEQKTLFTNVSVFMGLYWRNDKWRRASPQMLDRNMRALGLGNLTSCPWGPGPEMGYAVDDMIAAAGGASGVATSARIDGLGEG